MSEKEQQEHSFITYLGSLAQREDRRALAALRRGLGQRPGSTPAMFPYIVPWLREVSRRHEAAFYTVASLFAYHPKQTNKDNMGTHLAMAKETGREEALERRFVALLSAHADDLPAILRQTISLLASKDIPVNWTRLFQDMRSWDHPDYGDEVRKRWATAFWRTSGEKSSDSDTE